jgi:hypothetical protein
MLLKVSQQKIIFLILVFLSGTFFFSFTDQDAKTVRDHYRKALTSESDIPTFKTHSAKHQNSALGKAYFGTALALEARAAWSPSTKLSNAKAAFLALNEAVKLDAKNIEIRFLRLSFAHGTPDFLSMKTSITEDKKIFLQGNIKSHPIGDIMQKFMTNSGLFTAAEKSSIK